MLHNYVACDLLILEIFKSLNKMLIEAVLRNL